MTNTLLQYCGCTTLPSGKREVETNCPVHGAQAFADKYAAQSGTTVEYLKEHGREVRRCDCGQPDCKGWQMAHIKS